MSAFLRQYLTVAIFGGAAVLMVGAMLGLGRLVRPTRPQGGKYLNYECGVDPVGVGWSQSQIRYYVFALLFVIFDVEAVFIFPWAASIERYGTFGLVVMVAFIVLLLDGLLYAWKRGLLRWV
jgi:NADH-quinone oxidoreductase subunit A